ncbi:uncharacterized protein LOC119831295 [Zerene cesonia]|uniref:uncharacterized protein LOC119831295 n=1 Tax=Zerene cesonia TaxID=33412 RepID=UPI0018E5A455|nr:uncharacterized protein LOC119831295 [Zerene cesonia]
MIFSDGPNVISTEREFNMNLGLLRHEGRCQIEGITNWLIQVEESVIDTQIGAFFDRSTSNIQSITNVLYRDGLNRGPYIDVELRDSRLIVSTNDNFKEYEEYETLRSMGVTVSFSCTGSSPSVSLVMIIHIIDTNNNAPRFIPTDNYEFFVIPPLPPGFTVTGCDDLITARDIDLTTQRVDFAIEDNPYFEIFYDTTSSTPKEFNAVLRAKALIRTIPESLNFTITATDVDETGDPPLSQTATVRITANEQFLLPDELIFSRTFYIIHYTSEHTLKSEDRIYLTQGYDDEVKFTFDGQHSNYFNLKNTGNEITFEVKSQLPADILRENQIYLIVRGDREHTTGTSATVIIQLPTDTPIEQDATFDKLLYMGRLEENVVTHEAITIHEYSGDISVSGEYGDYFTASISNGAVLVQIKSTIPTTNVNYIALKLIASHASAVLILDIAKPDTPIEPDTAFDKVLYMGRVEQNVVTHEAIMINEYSGDITVSGDYADFFIASLSNGAVTVQATTTIPTTNQNYIALTLVASRSTAVLILDIIQSESPVPPSVSFSSPSYIVRTDEAHTGLIGRVAATADNGEAVTYSLEIQNAHLQERLFINDNGEIHSSAPVDVGTYSFLAVATTVITRISATAIIQLTVEASVVCNDTITLPPLLIIERYEEEPHSNLVPLEAYPNCQYQLANKWPIDQTWIYVDQNGLHTRSIDREHESIAFMHLSQVQVELNLHCDNELRSKRSLSTDVENDPKSYDFGPNNWILTESIQYNPRRSLVNLIVLDINDNAPIFVGKENEPITVGYPRGSIEEVILPRALAELKATDADIGENAELRYWSSDNNIAVAPTTGSVHVRNLAALGDNTRIVVKATDRNGSGLTGSIELSVKLLDTNHIAVVSVRNAFVNDEKKILDDLSSAVGYEIKALKSTVVSERTEGSTRYIGYERISQVIKETSRKRREIDATGALLSLYIYGLRNSQLIDVTQLTRYVYNCRDLNNNNVVTVSLAQVLSLEDYLEGLQICPVPERETGLLAATIVLAVALFIIIVAIAVLGYLKWRKIPTYDHFSDQSSLASRHESIAVEKPDFIKIPDDNIQVEKPDFITIPEDNIQVEKPDFITISQNNIDEMKRTERSLEELLDTPQKEINEVIVEPVPAEEKESPKMVSYELPNDTIVNISTTNPTGPIVIQSIDKLKDNVDESEDDDEFGEKQRARRKSVVTFNENVEKIIHLEDRTDDESESEMEVYEF